MKRELILLMNHSIKILNYQICFFIRIRKYQKEVRIQLEAVLSEDQFLGLYGIIGCGVQAYEVRNGPILEIAELRDFSIPKSQNNYILLEQFVPGNFFIGFSWEKNMSIFIMIILIFIGVFDFVWIMRHFKF